VFRFQAVEKQKSSKVKKKQWPPCLS